MDTTNLPSTWQEALENHTVGNARIFERQLRSSVLRDKEKLRALVGSNYRDFLATAEQIVELDEQTRGAESKISSLSRACQPPVLWDDVQQTPKNANVASQLKLVDQMLRSASKATKERSVLLASRLVVISRLLIKHLDENSDTKKAVQWLQNRLKTIKQYLLNRIDSMLTNPTTAIHVLSQATVAYCLTTSSSSSDGVKHFQRLRSQKIAQVKPESATKLNRRIHIKQKCHYLVVSVTATRALFGRAVIELLNNLQKQPLLEDETILQMGVLQIDLYRDLLPADILSFTPYFKRVVPTTSEVQNSIQSWVNDATKYIARDIEDAIRTSNLISVLRARTEILEVLLPSCFTTSIHKSAAFENIRITFSKKILELLRDQSVRLQQFCGDFQTNELTTDEGSFWKSDAVRDVNTRSSNAYLRTLRRLQLGIQKDLESQFQQLRRWAALCSKTREELNSMGRTRWQDKIEEYDDDDEEAAQEILTALSKHDPQQFTEEFESALRDAANAFVTVIAEQATETAGKKVETEAAHQTTNLLRVIREIHTILNALIPSQKFESLITSALKLQFTLAEHTATELFKAIESKHPGVMLSFTTEDLPSPLTVSVLQTLALCMLEKGGIDLWTKPAVRKVRNLVLQRALSAEKRDFYIRSELDEKYLEAALAEKFAETKPASDSAARKAASYWNRTKTLYGILCT